MAATALHASSRTDMTLLPYSPQRDVYRLLGVTPSASTDEILGACRRLARTFHPDRNRSPRATAEMRVVNAVRDVMVDPHRRAEYDHARRRWLSAALAPSPAGPLVSPASASYVPPGFARRRYRARYARAAWLGFRATVVALAPPRCRRCRTVIPYEDAYCAACGNPLLTGG